MLLQGVLIAERLSVFHIGSVRSVTGGQLISSFSLQYPQQWLGRLRDIKSTSIEGTRYIGLPMSQAAAEINVYSYSH